MTRYFREKDERRVRKLVGCREERDRRMRGGDGRMKKKEGRRGEGRKSIK